MLCSSMSAFSEAFCSYILTKDPTVLPPIINQWLWVHRLGPLWSRSPVALCYVLARRQEQFESRPLIFGVPSVSHVICLQYSAAWRITQNSICDSIVPRLSMRRMSMSAGPVLSLSSSALLAAAGICICFECASCGASCVFVVVVLPRVFKRYIKIRATGLNVTFYLDSCTKITLHCLTEMLLAGKWS